MSKPYSQACENNKAFILEVIAEVFRPGETVLEIGSGTGQHACYFADRMPGITWQPSDAPGVMETLEAGLAGEEYANLRAPVTLDVRARPWSVSGADGIFSANCLHIMSKAEVEDFMAGAGEVVAAGGPLCVYGPFNYGGEHTSESNARFDEWLRLRDPASGIRDLEWVDALARRAGFTLENDHAMPANNRLVVWRKAE